MGMLLLLEVEEEMEGRMVVELMVAKGRRRSHLVASLLAAKRRRRRENEREREWEGYLYTREVMIASLTWEAKE